MQFNPSPVMSAPFASTSTSAGSAVTPKMRAAASERRTKAESPSSLLKGAASHGILRKFSRNEVSSRSTDMNTTSNAFAPSRLRTALYRPASSAVGSSTVCAMASRTK